MRQQFAVLHKLLLDTVRGDPVCRRLMTAPGVGAVVALTYRATVDQPQRFVHSRAVGAHVGLTPKRYQSGEIDYDGGVSKCGDALLRTMLYEAAQSLLTHGRKWSWLKAWGMRVAQRRGIRRAIVAVARRLAVVLHRMWVDGNDAPSRLLTFDLRTNTPTTVSEVDLLPGEPTRADELAYDPKDGLILAINNASTPPVATLVSVNQTTGALAVVKNIFLDTARSGVDAQDGAEQPVWDPGTQKFYLSIPVIGTNPTVGGVIRISITGTVEATYTITFCSPAGLAIGPNENLLVGCNTIWATNGSLWTGNASGILIPPRHNW
jgi:hypothetical protein